MGIEVIKPLNKYNNEYNNEYSIDSFKVKNGVVTIKYKNLKKFRTLYTEELKEQLLSSMEKNFNNYKERLSFFEDLLFYVELNSIPMVIYNALTIGGLINLIFLVSITFGFSYHLIKQIKNTLKNAKKKKQQFYIDYKDELNNRLSDNTSIMFNLNKKTIHKLSKIEARDKSLDINNVSELSISELRLIKACLCANGQLGIKDEYFSSDMGSLIKKYDNISDKELYSDGFKTISSTELIDNEEKIKILLKEKQKLKQKFKIE